MKKETKQNIKQKVIDKPVTNIKSTIKQKQNRLISYLAFLLLLFLLVSFMVPVYYVPLFKKISTRYGLTSNITKKLTLFDLALNSLGIETSNMSAAFQKQDIEYGHDVFYTSRFSLDGKNRLINAKETYYHEYEKTKKRPAEIAGIYKDSTDINIPEIDGNLRGIRALPKGDFRDDNFDLNYKKNDIAGNLGGKRRHVRGSFDRSGENVENQSGAEKHEPLPDFAASIYVQDETEEAQTLNNSRMVKPIVEGEPFSVARSQNVIAKLVGDSSFTDTFAALKNFGGYGGALGYYIKDDLPKEGLFDFFGNSGRDAFTSYFYSHAAIDRKYIESSKHLSR